MTEIGGKAETFCAAKEVLIASGGYRVSRAVAALGYRGTGGFG